MQEEPESHDEHRLL